MNSVLPALVVALPFVSAVALSLVPSWRIGTWINAGATSLLFLLAGSLLWQPKPPPPLVAGVTQTHLVLLTSLLAMVASWYGRRDVIAALVARTLDRRRVRVCHVAFQVLLGAIVLAVMADRPALTWLALAVAAASAAAMTESHRLLLPCGVGLLLALVGTVLLGPVPDLASIFLLLGFGALAGLVPLHAWQPDALAEAFPPGAILLTLLANAPLVLLVRLQAGVLIVGGLASLLLGAVLLSARTDLHRTVAFAGTAQLGMVVFAFGIGGPAATAAGWLHMTLLALIRATVLQGRGDRALEHAGLLALALLPLFALFLLAGPTAAWSVWLLLPLGIGALLTSWFLLPTLRGPDPASDRPTSFALAPVWMELGLAAVLAFAMPGPVAAWFHAMTAGG